MAEMQMKEQRAKDGAPDANVADVAGREIFPRNHYNTEVLHITTDYLQALKSIQTNAP
jgi:hypothetical protein